MLVNVCMRVKTCVARQDHSYNSSNDSNRTRPVSSSLQAEMIIRSCSQYIICDT